LGRQTEKKEIQKETRGTQKKRPLYLQSLIYFGYIIVKDIY